RSEALSGLTGWLGGPIGSPGGSEALSGLLVEGVSVVPPAVLLHLDPLAVVQLVLGGDVVAALAQLTRQRDLYSLLVLWHELLLIDASWWLETGSGGRTRTGDPTIMSRVL